MASTQLDDAFHYIGRYGRYQVFASVIITIIGAWFPSMHIMGIIFSVDRPLSYRCTEWSDGQGNVILRDSVMTGRGTWITDSIRNSSSEITNMDDECTASDEATGVISCTSWQYYTQYNESTIVTEVRTL